MQRLNGKNRQLTLSVEKDINYQYFFIILLTQYCRLEIDAGTNPNTFFFMYRYISFFSSE